MVNSPSKVGFVAVCASLWLVLGCGGDGARTFGGGETGGATASSGGSPGSGGMIAATGGANATGGRGVGGRNGSGGAGNSSSGGARASGGTVGTGGAIGTGGASSSGGTVGSTGGAGAGSGTGGAGGANSAACDQFAAEYQAEMPNAKTCSLATTVPQCQMQVPESLGCSCRNIYVQAADHLTQIHNKWTAAGCDSILRLCPLIACVQGQPGNCAISGTVTTPQCQLGPPIATPD